MFDLNKVQSKWSLTGYAENNRKRISEYHLKARDIIKELYPTMTILEEVAFNPKRGQTLYLDFYIPMVSKAIEVHGEQHYKFTPHFHSSPMAFAKQKSRDRDKKEWCAINNIQYIELPYNNMDEWKRKIANV